MSEEALINLVLSTLKEWNDEEVEANGEGSISREDRFEESYELFIERLQEAKEGLE